jgi:hypothetical protein
LFEYIKRSKTTTDFLHSWLTKGLLSALRRLQLVELGTTPCQHLNYPVFGVVLPQSFLQHQYHIFYSIYLVSILLQISEIPVKFWFDYPGKYSNLLLHIKLYYIITIYYIVYNNITVCFNIFFNNEFIPSILFSLIFFEIHYK